MENEHFQFANCSVEISRIKEKEFLRIVETGKNHKTVLLAKDSSIELIKTEEIKDSISSRLYIYLYSGKYLDLTFKDRDEMNKVLEKIQNLMQKA